MAGTNRPFEVALEPRSILVSPRGRFKQILNLRIEVSGYRDNCLTPVGCKEARHRVVSEMHSVCAFVHQDCGRSVRRRVRNGLDHFLHDEWIPDDEAENPGALSASFLSQDFTHVEARELHQVRGSNRGLHHPLKIAESRRRSERAIEHEYIRAADACTKPAHDILEWSLRDCTEPLNLYFDDSHFHSSIPSMFQTISVRAPSEGRSGTDLG